jgi:hypothetical protein
MTRSLTLLALCACNQTFGVREVVVIDGPSPDAPFACPAPGMALQFSPLVHPWMVEDCADFTMDGAGTLAIGMCVDPTTSTKGIAQGPIAGPLVVASQFQGGSVRTRYDQPRLGPDATELYLRDNYASGQWRYEVYRRQPDGTWQFGTVLPFVDPSSLTSGDYSISSIARGDRALVTDKLTIQEWAQDTAGNWQSVAAAYTPVELGLFSLEQAVDLSIDGLLLVLAATESAQTVPAMYIASRATVSDRFGKATRLVGAPTMTTLPFLSPDCARLYVEGLQRVFYVQQL